jgi:hypothetical protein
MKKKKVLDGKEVTKEELVCKCGLELGDWLFKWSDKKELDIETIIGIMESMKVVYLIKACDKANVLK